MNIPSMLCWRIIGCDAEFDQDNLNDEITRYQDLHYDRFTYYPLHDQARLQRDTVTRRL